MNKLEKNSFALNELKKNTHQVRVTRFNRLIGLNSRYRIWIIKIYWSNYSNWSLEFNNYGWWSWSTVQLKLPAHLISVYYYTSYLVHSTPQDHFFFLIIIIINRLSHWLSITYYVFTFCILIFLFWLHRHAPSTCCSCEEQSLKINI